MRVRNRALLGAPIALLVLVLGLVEATLAAPPPLRAYALVNLTGLSGTTSSAATAINDRGHVVGYVQIGPTTRAVVWEENQQPRDLGTLAGTSDAMAFAINDRGSA